VETEVTALRATFHFEVRRLCVARELLGTSHELERDGSRVRVTFPSRERTSQDEGPEFDPSIFPEWEPLPLIEGAGEVTSTTSVEPSEDFATIDAVRVEVFLAGPVSAETYADPGADAHILASEASWSAMETAKRVVETLIAWLRVTPGQPWLGLSGEEPWPSGRSRLDDLDASLRLPYTFSGRRLVIQQIAEEQIIGLDRLESALRRIEAHEDPELADSLLADAWFLNSHQSDAPRVILSAAIACELKVKQALRELAKPEAEELLDVLLESRRDHSLAAAALFHKPMAAVAGVSLRDFDRDLWKQVQRLFETRNKIAHRGYVPTGDEALDCLRAATRVFNWLDALHRIRDVG
jgi:hypothetical protein